MFRKAFDYVFSYIVSEFVNSYIPDVFTERPYSKPLERNEVYIPIITLTHSTSHDFKWHKPWRSTIWLDFDDIMTSFTLPLLAEKLCVNIFLLQF